MDNPRADRVKRTAELLSRTGRKRQGRFLAEGPQAVREALKLWLQMWAGAPVRADLEQLPALDALYFDPQALERHPDVAALVNELRAQLYDPQNELPKPARVFVREATPAVLKAMSEAQTPQGMVAVCRLPPEVHPPPMRLSAALCGLQDPGNVGTLIRTADAAEADAVFVPRGTTDPWAPKVVRSAAGAHFHVPIIAGWDVAEVVELAQTQQMQVLAAAGGAPTSLFDSSAPGSDGAGPDLARSTMWLLGNEARGLDPDVQASADFQLAIPIFGQAESLNVAVAGGLCLYASARAQHETHRSVSTG